MGTPYLMAQAIEDMETPGNNRVEALSSLLTAMESVRTEVSELRTELAAATSEPDRERLEERLVERSEQLQELERRFRESSAGVDLSLFEEEEKESFSWEQTLGKILEPVLDEVEKATATSRKRSELRAEEDRYSRRAEVAQKAVDRIGQTLPKVTDSRLLENLETELKRWEERRMLAENRAQAASLQLEDMDRTKEGFVGETTGFIRSFLAERGLNLLMGIAAALFVFFGLRLLLALIQKVRIGDRPDNFGSRIFLLLTNLLSIVGAVTALLIAFSAAGDLFLLGIVLIFLIGAAWAGIQVIPQFIESLKIVLNIGMVREKQRLLFDGIPWHVESIGFSCLLVNNELDAAKLILPVRRLVGFHSRPWCADEKAFPCCRGDWVELSDGTIGQSVSQNPGTVTLREWGGSEVTLQTPDFLEKSPRNLTLEGFQVVTQFGIDYAHQEICTTEVPAWFTTALEEKLPEIVDAGDIRSIRVLFASAGASSLDYAVQVDLAGCSADKYREVKYAVQRILVDVCNTRDLVIPFQQLTVHHARDDKQAG
ncbi:MAG: hypothetical protein R6V45_12430 [Oceanipulchritudo sp.]